jgi:hypothetical protein
MNSPKLPIIPNQDLIKATRKLFSTLEERDRLIKLGQNITKGEQVNA